MKIQNKTKKTVFTKNALIDKSKLIDIDIETIFFSEEEAKNQFESLKQIQKEGCSIANGKTEPTKLALKGYKSTSFAFIYHTKNQIIKNGYNVRQQLDTTAKKEQIGIAFIVTYKLVLNGNYSYVEGELKTITKSRRISRLVSIIPQTNVELLKAIFVSRGLNGESGRMRNSISEITETTGRTIGLYDEDIIDSTRKRVNSGYNKTNCEVDLPKELLTEDEILKTINETFNLNLTPISIENRNEVWKSLLKKYPNNTGLCVVGDVTPNTRNKEGNYSCGYKYCVHKYNPDKPRIDGIEFNEIVTYGLTCVDNKDKVVDDDSLVSLNKIVFTLTDNNIVVVGGNTNKSTSQLILTEVVKPNNQLSWYFEGVSKCNSLNNGDGVSSIVNTITSTSVNFFNLNPRGSTNDNTNVKETASNQKFSPCVFE